MNGMSHFERLLGEAMEGCKDAALNVPLGDSLRHALVKGEWNGLQRAEKLWRESFKLDDEGDVQ